MSVPTLTPPPFSPHLHNLRQRGFTLIELLMVIAVIVILVGITFGISRGVQNAQASAKAQSELAVISQAIEQFKSRYGDYPWTTDPATNVEANAERLLLALTGWMQFETNMGNTAFTVVDPADQPANGPDSWIDISKFTLRQIGSDADYVDVPDISSTVPTGYYIADPWGQPYVFVHGKSDSASNTWDILGYHLYSMGQDQAHDPSVIDPQTGVLSEGFRTAGDGSNTDNIYSGE